MAQPEIFFWRRQKLWGLEANHTLSQHFLIRISRKQRRSMGRPSFHPTRVEQKTVEVLTYAGWTQDRIAVVIRISPKTLRRHFRGELDHGPARCQTELVSAVRRRAARGSKSAQRLLERLGLHRAQD